ncbi:MAG: peptidoglycan/xylan/chitin deacetylase (PgdA/CDA1 family) [Planctomycetota bacterium]|jgi:peptidoglycan/xylan/chitin deacetylase (PgdA/CDA1 family)
MLKRRIRTIFDHAAGLTGLLHGLELRMRKGLTVLMYHRVLPEADCTGYPLPTIAMPRGLFEAQVRWLASNCTVLPLSEALAASTTKHDQPIVSITFDDGYKDNIRIAAPVLESAGVRGTFYVTTDFIEGEELWFDRACRLLASMSTVRRGEFSQTFALAGMPSTQFVQSEDPGPWLELMKQLSATERKQCLDTLEDCLNPAPRRPLSAAMTPADLASLEARGHEIGSHTCSHPILPQLNDEELEHELAASQEKLLAWCKNPKPALAYPNGDHDERVRRRADQLGYSSAVTTRAGRFDGKEAFSIPRRDITPGSVSDHRGRFHESSFRAELSALHELLR